MKVDINVAPHFYSPRHSRSSPKFGEILEGLSKTPLNLIGITSCHTATSGIDTRWEDYMNQELPEEWEKERDTTRGLCYITNLKTGRNFVLMNTQKVRTYEWKNPADLLVFGLEEVVQPSRTIKITAQEVKYSGGYVLVPNPDTLSSASFDTAVGLFRDRLVQGIEISATNSEKYRTEIIQRLEGEGITAFPSSNAKRYSQAGKSWAEMQSEENDGVDLEKIAIQIKNGHFRPHHGQISRLDLFLSRDIHILKSMIPQYLSGGKSKEELLKATGLKK